MPATPHSSKLHPSMPKNIPIKCSPSSSLQTHRPSTTIPFILPVIPLPPTRVSSKSSSCNEIWPFPFSVPSAFSHHPSLWNHHPYWQVALTSWSDVSWPPPSRLDFYRGMRLPAGRVWWDLQRICVWRSGDGQCWDWPFAGLCWCTPGRLADRPVDLVTM